jgi:hypothetical protein
MNLLTRAKKLEVIKFCVGWLPTGYVLNRHHNKYDHWCPWCWCDQESNQHILTCTHPEVQKIRSAWYSDLLSFFDESHTAPVIRDFLQEGIVCFLRNRPYRPYKYFTTQQHLGWVHIFYGHLTHELIQAQTNYYKLAPGVPASHRKLDGISWGKCLIVHCWDLLSQLWKARCQQHHSQSASIRQLKIWQGLQARARECYKQQQWVSHSDRAFFALPMDQLIEKDNNYLEQWLMQAEELIRLNQHDHKHKLRKTMRPLQSYFPLKNAMRPCIQEQGQANIDIQQCRRTATN